MLIKFFMLAMLICVVLCMLSLTRTSSAVFVPKHHNQSRPACIFFRRLLLNGSMLLLCSSGLLDGPMLLVASLLAFGGSSAAGLEVLQAGLGRAVVAAAACSSGEGGLCELSPPGVLCLIAMFISLTASAGPAGISIAMHCIAGSPWQRTRRGTTEQQTGRSTCCNTPSHSRGCITPGMTEHH